MAKQVWLFDPRIAERKLMDINMIAGIEQRKKHYISRQT